MNSSFSANQMSSQDRHFTHYLALGLVSAIAQADLAAQPFMIGAWVDHFALSPAAASFLALSETLSLVVFMFGSSSLFRVVKLQWLGLFGTVVALLGQLATSSLTDFWHLEGVRCVVGASIGVVGAAANAAAARAGEPERAFGVSTAAMVLLFSALSALLPWAGQYGGPKGMFLALAIVQLIAVPVWGLLRLGAPPSHSTSDEQSGTSSPGTSKLAVMITMLLMSSGIGAVAAVSERIGHEIGLTAAQIGRFMAFSYLVSLIGPGFVTRIGLRFGHFYPIMFGLVGCALSCLALGLSAGSLGYAMALTAYTTVWWIGYSYLMGIAAAVDPAGRLATFTGAMVWLGSVAGTGAAGVVATSHSYPAVGWLAAVCCSMGVATIWHSARKVDLPTMAASAAT